MSSAWLYLPPLVLVGAAFLVLIELVGWENRRDQPLPLDEPSNAVRWVVMTLLLVASLAHIPVIPQHLHKAPYMGVLFIGFTLTAFGVASMLALRPSRVWYLIAGALCTAAVGTYVATRLVAFPQLADDVGAWTEPFGVVSISAEAAALMLAVMALRHV